MLAKHATKDASDKYQHAKDHYKATEPLYDGLSTLSAHWSDVTLVELEARRL